MDSSLLYRIIAPLKCHRRRCQSLQCLNSNSHRSSNGTQQHQKSCSIHTHHFRNIKLTTLIRFWTERQQSFRWKCSESAERVDQSSGSMQWGRGFVFPKVFRFLQGLRNTMFHIQNCQTRFLRSHLLCWANNSDQSLPQFPKKYNQKLSQFAHKQISSYSYFLFLFSKHLNHVLVQSNLRSCFRCKL